MRRGENVASGRMRREEDRRREERKDKEGRRRMNGRRGEEG